MQWRVPRQGEKQWQCMNCDASLEVTDHTTPNYILVSQSGRQELIVMMNGREVHRCQKDESAPEKRFAP